MCADKKAADDLLIEKTKGKIIVTEGNTVLDALNTTLDLLKPEGLPTGNYCLVNIHRFENLSSQERWQFMIEAILLAAKNNRVVFVTLPPTQKRLEEDVDTSAKLRAAGVELWPRQTFSRFMHMMHAAQFVLSDGGSNQQECFYLGKPCLLLRKVTESREGIGSTCVLSEFKMETVEKFLKDPMIHKGQRILPSKRPTDYVFESLGL
jgi:UDP-N-acetylglucosamine 2-epimerase (non-hydrolysing)